MAGALVRWCVARCGGGDGWPSSVARGSGVIPVARPPERAAFQCCEGRPVLGAVLLPVARPPERAARVPRPVCPGCCRCGRVDPAPAPQRAPLRAGVARCGGGGSCEGRWCQALSLPAARVPRPVCPGCGMRACGCQRASLRAGVSLWGWRKGVPVHRCEGRLVSGAVPSPAAVGACSQGSATRVSRVRSMPACGPSTGPTACALAGRRCSLWGWRKGVPGGGAFHRCEGRLVSGAVPSPAALVLRSVQPGFRDSSVPGAVDARVWTRHRPHSVRPCGPTLLAVGVAEGRPRGGCLPPL